MNQLCPKCGGRLIGMGATDPEACAEFVCDTCDYRRNLNEEFAWPPKPVSGARAARSGPPQAGEK